MYLVSLVYIIVGLLTSWIIYRLKNRKIFEGIKNCTELENYPLIGSAHLFVGRSPDEIFHFAVDKIKEMQSPIKVWICNKLTIVLSKPDDVQIILNSPDCLNKGGCYDLFPFHVGLVQIKKEHWKPHRKLLNPTLHITLIKSFFQTFNDVSIQLCEDLNLLTNKTEFDILSVVGYRQLDLSLQTTFGERCPPSTTQEIFDNLKMLQHLIGNKMVEYITSLVSNKIRRILKIESVDSKLLYKNYAHLVPIVEKYKMKYFAEVENNNGQVATDEEVRNKPEILVKKLIKLTELGYMDKSFIKNHTEAMLIAISHPLTVAISTILLLLAMEQDVQEQCVEELRNVLGENTEFIDLENISNLKYLDRAIKECLRVIPAVPFIIRKCDKDIKLDSCTIPEGTDIMIPIMNMHMDKQQWGEDSEKFNVDNFLPENVAKRHPVSYLPFSYGSRNCIGYKYAGFVMKIMIAHILLRFKLTTKLKREELKFSCAITIEILNNCLVSIENR